METIGAVNEPPAHGPVLSFNPDMSPIEAPVQSPCVGNCCLDDDLVCIGCFRSLDEIKEWGTVDNQRRRVILQNSARRKEPGLERE
jgi:predicted Fe-S protein YdhL (DUF1289 family)